MTKGNIIWLNGVSSSGKTTLAKVLQKKFEEPYYWLAHDTLNEMSSSKFLDMNPLEFEYQCAILLAHTTKLFSDIGRNVIVDTVFVKEPTVQKPETLKETVSILSESPVLFVHVACSRDELIRREIDRKDRHLGQAIAQLNDLIPTGGYDICVDTSLDSIEMCAQSIIEQVGVSTMSSFKELSRQFRV